MLKWTCYACGYENENRHPLNKAKKAVPLKNNVQESGVLVSTWHWRPGMKPRFALIIGVLFSVVGLLFVIIGLVSLIAGIQDSHSAPIQIPGVVTGYTTSFLDSLPHVIIRVEKENATTTISPAVSHSTSQSLHIGDTVIVDYSQRLNLPYALESGGQRYLLPGTSSAGNPFGSIALLTLGLIIIPYPAFLASWGWRDLQAKGGNVLAARILDLRSSKQARTSQPGITPRVFRTTYTVVLEPINAPFSKEVVAFSIKEEVFHALHIGTLVEITYSPNLHYIYAVKQVDVGLK
jgi:hypothetical protein